MNKLVIIGNGFDLAHGLKTKYSDFLLWEINEAFKKVSQYIKSPLFEVESSNIIQDHNSKPLQFKKIADFLKFKEDYKRDVRITYLFSFIERLIIISNKNWVDVETEYFQELINVYHGFEKFGYIDVESLSDLNTGFEVLKKELELYLKTLNSVENDPEVKNTLLEVYQDSYNDS